MDYQSIRFAVSPIKLKDKLVQYLLDSRVENLGFFVGLNHLENA